MRSDRHTATLQSAYAFIVQHILQCSEITLCMHQFIAAMFPLSCSGEARNNSIREVRKMMYNRYSRHYHILLRVVRFTLVRAYILNVL